MLQTRYKVLQAATTCGILKPAADKVGRQSELMLAEGGILRGGGGYLFFTREPVNPLILLGFFIVLGVNLPVRKRAEA